LVSARMQLRGSALEKCAGRKGMKEGKEGEKKGGRKGRKMGGRGSESFLTRPTNELCKGEATIEALVDLHEGEKMRGTKGVDRVGSASVTYERPGEIAGGIIVAH
jgi:hypothetical protein